MAKKSTALAKRKSTEVISMAEFEKLYAQEAVAAAEAAPTQGGIPFISTKSEMFTLGEKALPDPLDLIVVAEALSNNYYDSPYNPDVPGSPACAAVHLAVKGAEQLITSDPNSPNRQGGAEHRCLDCELNKFGSATEPPYKGKACANNRRLAVVFAVDPALRDPQLELSYALLNLAPTSLSSWGKFVTGLERAERRPPHGVVIKFSFDKRNPDERKRKAVIPVGYQLITEPVVAAKVKALRELLTRPGSPLLLPPPFDAYQAPSKHAKAKGPAAPKAKKPARQVAR